MTVAKAGAVALLVVPSLTSACFLYPGYRPLVPTYSLDTTRGPADLSVRRATALAVSHCYAQLDSLKRDAHRHRRNAAAVTLTSGAVSALGGAVSSALRSPNAKTVGGIVSALGGVFTLLKSTADSDPERVIPRGAAADSTWRAVVAAAVAYDTTGATWLNTTSTFAKTPSTADSATNRTLLGSWSRSDVALQAALGTCR